MSVKSIDNTTEILITTERNASLGLRFILDAIDQAAFPKTPKNRGELRKDIKKVVQRLHSSITWGENYAIYQENKQFKNYTTPGTGPHFAENAVRDVVKNASFYFRKAGL